LTLVQGNENLNYDGDRLTGLLIRYAPFLTSKPGNCTVFEYEFILTDERELENFSRPVPFSSRCIVKVRIQQAIRGGILETSNSPFINPVILVPREGKAPRICVHARKVNNVMIPGRERTTPFREFL
jgi:hypothetical protein